MKLIGASLAVRGGITAAALALLAALPAHRSQGKIYEIF